MKAIQGIKNIRESFKTRQVRYGGYAALLTLAVLAGLILVNLLIGQFSPQVDLTWSKLYSLSEQTMQVLDSVKTPVKFYGLWKIGEESEDVITVVNLYLAKNRNITLEVVDPDRNPGFVAKYDRDRTGISRGSLIVEGAKGFRVIAPYDMYDFQYTQQGSRNVTGMAVERRITSALLFAGTGSTPVIYETTGHDELTLMNLRMLDIIERENYEVKSVNLLLNAVPQDASAIIINNPRKDLTQGEAGKILDYLRGGGRVLVLADYNIQDFTNLNDVMASYGLKFEFGIVVENDYGYIAFNQTSELPDPNDHDITKTLMNKNTNPILLMGATSLTTLDTKRRTVEINPLITSSYSSFLRTDLDEFSYEKGPQDITGPLTLGVALTDPYWIDPNKPEPQARIVAIGCGNLLPIAAQMGVDANLDIFINSLIWLQDRPENITVRSKSLFILPLRLNMIQVIVFGGLFVFLIPVAFFVTGFITWLKRRHL